MNTGMILGAVIGLGASFGGFAYIIYKVSRAEFEKEAVSKGHAHFGPLTRNFIWNDLDSVDKDSDGKESD